MDYRAEHITYRYSADGPDVLKDVTMTIQKGKVTAIVGPSGCGKTTLLEIFSGIIPKLITNGVLSGTFEIPEGAFVSAVSQNPENQLFGYGVEDAIVFGMENMGLPQEEISERIEYVLDLLNLQYLRRRSVANLSGGQRQAVCIASVLAMNPDILLMDEPVSSLDPNGKKMVRGVLKQLAADDNTVVIVDNNLVWSADIVDHVIGLSDGKVVFDGDRDEFFKNFELQESLGVIVPQEVEIYRELKKHIPETEMFYTYEGAKDEIDRLFRIEDLKTPADADESSAKADTSAASDEYEDPIIRVTGLTKAFNDGFRALIDVDADIPEGKVIAVMGQNGSGKTTFLKHLNGLYRPTEGDVLYRGESVLAKTVAQISKNIILVFQHPEHMLFEETVEDELTFCARKQGNSYTKEDIEEILEKYGLSEDREQFPLNLSMGKKHMLTILSVLLSSADVIMLDEPTLGMDAFLIKELEELIASLKKAGKTVIMISHEIPLVFRVSDCALILGNGKKLAEGDIDEISAREELFDSINIELPAAVRLSNELGLEKVCRKVPDFVNSILECAERR